jgi:hypothetical protein
MRNIDLSQFTAFLTEIEQPCRIYLYQLLGVNGNCPRCGSELGKSPLTTLMKGKRSFCKACQWMGTGRDGTVFHNSKISDAQGLLLFAFLTVGADRDKASKLLGIAPVTYDVWKDRLQPLLILDEQKRKDDSDRIIPPDGLAVGERNAPGYIESKGQTSVSEDPTVQGELDLGS